MKCSCERRQNSLGTEIEAVFNLLVRVIAQEDHLNQVLEVIAHLRLHAQSVLVVRTQIKDVDRVSIAEIDHNVNVVTAKRGREQN